MSTTGRVARERAKQRAARAGVSAGRGPRASAPAPKPTVAPAAAVPFDETMARGPIALVGWLALRRSR